MVTARYSDQQGSKLQQKVTRLYKQCHRSIMSKRFIKPLYPISRAASIDSDCCLLPTTSILSNKADNLRSRSVLINKPKFLKATHRTKIKKNEIPRSMVVVEASSW